MIQHEGSGWRVARDSSRSSFPVLIGGDGWALELTEEEWTSLIPLLEDLIEQHKKLENQLIPEESISLEIERKPWWACLDGDRDSWSLQLILGDHGTSIRGFEVYWPIPAAQSITSAMRSIHESSQ
ncbi:DUF1818 family protein [Prochlorococcus sp. MIT 1307]|uniref:DUF1818 family protein n=1 Tax=Prochlorococcus sp. MIT 1307 TaxID=3096219 RepID=UPI002A75AE11|nr:DUF1818 family protein [Prochlorococcus sp. MIT 1307]